MSKAATHAVAAVNGAFDANIVIPRCPSFRNARITVTSLQIECQSDYERKPDLHVQVSAFSLKVITDNPTFRKTHDGLAYSYRGAHKYPEAAAQDGSGMMVMSLI